jgi:hypothetical protein
MLNGLFNFDECRTTVTKMMCGPSFRITHLTEVVFFEF